MEPGNKLTTSLATPNEVNASQLERQLALLIDQADIITRLKARLGDVSVSSAPPKGEGVERGAHISDLNARIIDNNDELRTIIDELAI